MSARLALVASGLIALSSCSSGPASSTGAGAGAGAATIVAPTASIRVGPVTEEFATPLPDDPVKVKVIEAWRESQVIWEQSVQGWRVVADATAYVTGSALTKLHNAVSTDVSYHVILTGTNRLYDTSVTSLTAHGATLTSCDDASKVIDYDPSTRQKYPNPPGAVVIFLTIWQLVPASGHWAIASYSLIPAPDQRERACAAS